MAKGISNAGIMGIAFESTPGTYVAPTKFFPFRSEGLAWKQETVWRRAIRGIAVPLGAIPGNGSFDGDIVIEALPDVVPYFVYASRATTVKTGTGPWTYTATGNVLATPPTGRTLSITIVRNGVVFGYTNCIVAKSAYSIDAGALIATYSMMGSDETVQSAPTATYSTVIPFGAGEYIMEIPTATAVFDTDNWQLTIDDSGQNAYRLRNTGRGPAFAWWGDTTIEITVDRDFENRTEYDAFKALTSKSITFKAIKGGDTLTFVTPVSIADEYAVALGGTGELVRANTKYQGVHNPAGAPYTITSLTTTENIT
jgi:hypothetical protein